MDKEVKNQDTLLTEELVDMINEHRDLVKKIEKLEAKAAPCMDPVEYAYMFAQLDYMKQYERMLSVRLMINDIVINCDEYYINVTSNINKPTPETKDTTEERSISNIGNTAGHE